MWTLVDVLENVLVQMTDHFYNPTYQKPLVLQVGLIQEAILTTKPDIPLRITSRNTPRSIPRPQDRQKTNQNQNLARKQRTWNQIPENSTAPD